MQLLFLGHGSSNVNFISEFMYIVDLFRSRHPSIKVRLWVLEFSKLSLMRCLELGVKIYVLIPLILLDSKHVKFDVCVLSRFIQSVRKSSVVLQVGGLCSVLMSVKLVSRLLKTCIICSGLKFDATNLILIIVFRGSSELKLNALAYSCSRILWEGSGCLWCENFFLGLTFPLFEFTRLLAIWRNNVVVVPLLLFYGNLYFVFQKYKLVTGHVFSEAVGINLLFKYLRRFLFEVGLSSCELCKYRLSN
ncbi:Sirohydrochlorin cobaltochelatase [Candidatus Hodgkinia cicadicola]|nr:Sirohydrochlorin cobaltochelatase [Candidatus Hodgkinia cicadicola]